MQNKVEANNAVDNTTDTGSNTSESLYYKYDSSSSGDSYASTYEDDSSFSYSSVIRKKFAKIYN